MVKQKTLVFLGRLGWIRADNAGGRLASEVFEGRNMRLLISINPAFPAMF